MHIVTRSGDWLLMSLGGDELRVLLEGLDALEQRRGEGSAAARALAAQLRDAPGNAREAFEIADAWADGGSVQVRAITVSGDPLDWGSEEAREFAEQVLRAAREADGESA